MKEFQISPELIQVMVTDVSCKTPEEACGLVAGVVQGNTIIAIEVVPVMNAISSQVRFRMDPREQLNAFHRIESNGWDLVAIYHSHPAGPPFPSDTDLEEHAYPGTFSLIWFFQDGSWDFKAFEYVSGISPLEAEGIATVSTYLTQFTGYQEVDIVVSN